jgi:cytochrome c oxidase subunit II
MIGKVVVMEEKDYQRWLAGRGATSRCARAASSCSLSMNCMSCHGTWAPTMAGLYMSNVKLADGRTVVADDAYIRRVDSRSRGDIVDGYQANSTVLMPTFRGTLTEEQIDQIVEYIKSLGSAANLRASRRHSRHRRGLEYGDAQARAGGPAAEHARSANNR